MNNYDPDYISRQISFLSEKNLGVDEIQKLIAGNMGEEYVLNLGQDIDGLKKKYTEPVILRLIESIKYNEGDIGLLIPALHHLKHDVMILSQPIKYIFRKAIIYSAFLSIFLGILLATFAAFIIPEMRQLYGAYGEGLPGLTQFIFEPVITIILFIIPWLIMFYLIFMSVQIRKSLILKNDLSNWILHIPVFSGLIQHYYIWLYLEIIQILIMLDETTTELITKSKNIVFKNIDEKILSSNKIYKLVTICIEGAIKLDNQKQEVEYLRAKLELEQSMKFSIVNEKILISVYIFFAVIVGILVVGLYLPIFSMGAVI